MKQRVLSTLLTLIMLPSISIAETKPLEFKRYYSELDVPEYATVIPGFFFANETTDIAAIWSHKPASTKIAYFTFQGSGWEKHSEREITRNVVAVDKLTSGKKEHLLLATASGLNIHEPGTNQFHELLQVPHQYRNNDSNSVPRISMAKDLNNNSLDDIVVPTIEGFHLAIQQDSGAFDQSFISMPEQFRNRTMLNTQRPYRELGVTSQTVHWYLDRIHRADFTGNGRVDLAFWNGSRFLIFPQREDGTFTETAIDLPITGQFEVDGLYSLHFVYEDSSVFKLFSGLRKSSRHRVLQSIVDVTGDGVSDLVIFVTEGRSVLRQRSWFEVFPGNFNNGHLEFATESSFEVSKEGRTTVLVGSGYGQHLIRDIDGDAHYDLMVWHVNMGASRIARAMLANSITVNIEFFRGQDSKLIPSKGDNRKIRPPLKVLSRQGPFSPAVILGDLTGDGKSDLLLGNRRNEMQFYRASDGEAFFEPNPLTIKLKTPSDERRLFLTKFNRTGQQAIFVDYSGEPREIAVLLAR